MQQPVSPITGIIEEDQVFIDFGEHEGKSILEVADTPLIIITFCDRKENGHCIIRRLRTNALDYTFQNQLTKALKQVPPRIRTPISFSLTLLLEFDSPGLAFNFVSHCAQFFCNFNGNPVPTEFHRGTTDDDNEGVSLLLVAVI